MYVVKQLSREIDARRMYHFLLRTNELRANSLGECRIDDDRRKLIIIIVVVFVLAFVLGWFLRCYVCPCSWAKMSLTVTVSPESQIRGGSVIISGSLIGEDVANKLIAFIVTDPSGTVIKTFNATTDENGIYSYICEMPPDREPGKYTITASYGTLSASTNVFVKLAAPQEHGL